MSPEPSQEYRDHCSSSAMTEYPELSVNPYEVSVGDHSRQRIRRATHESALLGVWPLLHELAKYGRHQEDCGTLAQHGSYQFANGCNCGFVTIEDAISRLNLLNVK